LVPLHYGPVPHPDMAKWSLRIGGSTASGEVLELSYDQIRDLPTVTVPTDHHCVAKVTVSGLSWRGVAASTILRLVPPLPHVQDVLLTAEYGYSSNVRVADLAAAGAVLAYELGGEPLKPEHGWPLRMVLPHLYGYKGPKWIRAIDYLDYPERGFWEQRGFHFTGDIWREQRYAYQE
jgi:DMSO/TMAO reductase YedYZ molybdopterin-dependent catalytic subunit